jgi:hypothetical protein
MIPRRAFLACGCCAALGFAARAAAQARPMPFAPEELRRRGPRYAQWVQEVFRLDLVAQLPPPLPAQLADVRLATPAGEEGELIPLFFAAAPGTRTVVLPLRTLIFLDELAGLWAWLERRRCGHDPAFRYIAMLTKPMPGGARPPGPYAAFGLTETALMQDAFVKDVSNKLLSSTVFFMLAHELGHLHHRHRGGAQGLASQQQEREADAFALDAAAAVRLFPGGLSMFFATAALLEGGQSTHPLSGSRLEAIADGMRRRPRSFVDRDSRNLERDTRAVATLAEDVALIGRTVDDPSIRALLVRRGAETGFSALAGLCRS